MWLLCVAFPLGLRSTLARLQEPVERGNKSCVVVTTQVRLYGNLANLDTLTKLVFKASGFSGRRGMGAEENFTVFICMYYRQHFKHTKQEKRCVLITCCIPWKRICRHLKSRPGYKSWIREIRILLMYLLLRGLQRIVCVYMAMMQDSYVLWCQRLFLIVFLHIYFT